MPVRAGHTTAAGRTTELAYCPGCRQALQRDSRRPLDQKVTFMPPLGHHLLIDMWGCNSSIDDPDTVREALRAAVSAMQAQLLNLHVHSFSPQGVTAVATLAESHFALHSWPECDYLAADIFTCGPREHLLQAVAVLQNCFEPRTIDQQELPRGVRSRETAHPAAATADAKSALH